MRSPADRRIPFERVARGVALGLVALASLRAVMARGSAPVPAVHVDATGDLSAQARDSLVARARAGDAVTWSGDVAAIATVTEPVRDPSARTTILAVSDGALAIGDSLGSIDSLPAGGGAVTASGLRGAVRVGEGRTGASAVAPAAAMPGRVLVLGRVGWEAKFAIAALEEAGWPVDARLRLSDTSRVTQGDARALEAHAVVVALDTALGAEAAALLRFVRAGGGLVLSGEAAAAPALAAIAPARAGTRQEGEQGAFDAGQAQQALPLRPLGSLRAGSVVLERRDGTVAVAARRLAGGRVLQTGYDETWRWRMQGGASGPREHREWWTRLVAAASRSPTDSGRAGRPATGPRPLGSMDGAAPRATLVQRLGPAVSAAPATPPVPGALPAWLGILTLILLVAEWASRRARGAA